MRQQRNALGSSQQRQASINLSKRIFCTAVFLRAKCITGYFADDGEISLAPVFARSWQMKKHMLVPTIENKAMAFTPYNAQDKLVRGHFNLLEPEQKYSINPLRIDLMLVPLVAFDRAGNRLGRGGGFYDRFLDKLKRQSGFSAKPFLLGVAHHCQEVAAVPVAQWDIPLHAIATDKEIIWPRQA